MALLPYALSRSVLFNLDPEVAHELTMGALARFQNTPLACVWGNQRVQDPVTLAGVTFPNRVGMAAGLDKNGRCIDGLGAMGFGFVEVGTVSMAARSSGVSLPCSSMLLSTAARRSSSSRR